MKGLRPRWAPRHQNQGGKREGEPRAGGMRTAGRLPPVCARRWRPVRRGRSAGRQGGHQCQMKWGSRRSSQRSERAAAPVFVMPVSPEPLRRSRRCHEPGKQAQAVAATATPARPGTSPAETGVKSGWAARKASTTASFSAARGCRWRDQAPAGDAGGRQRRPGWQPAWRPVRRSPIPLAPFEVGVAAQGAEAGTGGIHQHPVDLASEAPILPSRSCSMRTGWTLDSPERASRGFRLASRFSETSRA